MTIEITKKGKLPQEKVYALRCGSCGTEFTCQKGDMEWSRDQRDPGYSVVCPLPGCGKFVWTTQS
jgi:hypothetical protein